MNPQHAQRRMSFPIPVVGGYEGFGNCELQVEPLENYFYLNSKLQEVYKKACEGGKLSQMALGIAGTIKIM